VPERYIALALPASSDDGRGLSSRIWSAGDPASPLLATEAKT
jgi:hypothetical protein